MITHGNVFLIFFLSTDKVSQGTCRRRGKLDHECTLYGLFIDSCMYKLSD